MEKIRKDHFNNPVVIILLVILIGFGGYFLFTKNNNSKVSNYYLEHGNFSVYFPKEPTYSVLNNTQIVEGGGYLSVDDYLFKIDGTTRNELDVGHTSSPFANSNLTPEENLKKEVNFTVNSGNGKLIDSSLTTFNGFPAIDYSGFNSEAQLYEVGRDILKDGDLYSLTYLYPSGQEDKNLEDAFFNSLKFGKSGNDKTIKSTGNSPSKMIFYIQSDSTNIHNCAASSCEIVGTYKINTGIALPYATVSDLPQWVDISEAYGSPAYVSKTTLATSKAPLIKKVSASTPAPVITSTPLSLPDIIKQWRSRTVYIECTWTYSDTGATYLQASGSGLAMEYSDGQISFLTNKHVLDDGKGYGPSKCLSKLPDDDTVYTSTLSDEYVSKDSSDWGYLNITNPDAHLKELVGTSFNYCTTKASIGESVVILGYPSYGTSFYDITATEGIISGYDGQYYTTSAKIEHGNSGGLAIHEKNNCYLGIPTGVVTGGFESLGRILDVKNIFK
jgi:hypothetical protein